MKGKWSIFKISIKPVQIVGLKVCMFQDKLKKVILFPEIGRMKTFLSLTRLDECLSEYL